MYYGRKKGIIIGVTIAVIVLVLAITSIFIVLKTDLFKSNKTLFWKYMSNGTEAYKIAQNTQLEDIEKLKLQNPYTIQGQLTASSNDEEISETLEKAKISINSQTDKTNNYGYGNFKIEFDEAEMFNLKYSNADDVYAIKSDEIITVYLGIRNENLKVLLQKLGVQDVSAFPDKIETKNYDEIFKFTEEELKHIKETYIEVIEQSIPNDSYSKQTGAVIENAGTKYNTTSYRLDLSADQMANILANILKTLQTDSITLNLIATKAKALGAEVTIQDITNGIEDMISEIEEIEFTDTSFVVYNHKGKTIAAEIIIKNEQKMAIYNMDKNIKITVEDLSSSADYNVINMNIAYQMTTTQSYFDIKVEKDSEEMLSIELTNTGAAATRKLDTTCEVKITTDENETVNLSYNQTLEFVDKIDETEKINETNCAILNDYSKEDLQNVIQAVAQKTVEVFSQKLQSFAVYNSAYNAMNSINNDNNLDDSIIEAFNSKFTGYIGEDVKGNNVKTLCRQIANNNTSSDNENKKKVLYEDDINGVTGQSEIEDIISQIQNTKIYNVEAKYSEETKLIDTIIIKEN